MLHQEWLQSFQVFARYLNFTHAAAHLNISQPALHVQIKKLSESLGVVLYQRHGRALVLTDAGKRTASFAGEMAARTSHFRASLLGGETHHPVSFVAGQGAYLYLIGEGIRAFRNQENAPLQLHTADAEGAVAAVRGGKAHLGVSMEGAVTPDLHSTLLASVPYQVALPDGHVLTAKERLSPKDLKGETFVLPPKGKPHRQALDAVLGNPMVSVEALGWELMLHFSALGMGLTIVNGCCVLPTGLVGRPFMALSPVRYVLCHRKTDLHGPGKTLKSLLLETTTQWRTVTEQ